ncbi:hypothetical protein V5799_025251 [Amblyomma americanum]|uniref:Uncharacterized protein n=1 Tax=Amblyomma americanum TaxID=6943 RepID=A0AAQ4E9W0_AMBAM
MGASPARGPGRVRAFGPARARAQLWFLSLPKCALGDIAAISFTESDNVLRSRDLRCLTSQSTQGQPRPQLGWPAVGLKPHPQRPSLSSRSPRPTSASRAWGWSTPSWSSEKHTWQTTTQDSQRCRRVAACLPDFTSTIQH